jgi:hypothetical protein
MFISIDPGIRVGVASFKEDGTDISRTTFQLDSSFKNYLKGLYQFSIKEGETIRFIYEDFTLRKDKAIDQTGSNMPASRAIGMVEMVHWMLGEKSYIHSVSSANLRTALKWAGFPQLAAKPRTWHCPDDISAYSHGVMWLIQNNVRQHPIFKS